MLLLRKIIFTLCMCSFASCETINEPHQENVKPETRIPYSTYNECGGYIEAKFDQTIILEYKLDEEYDNDEFCVWEVRNDDCDGALFTKTKSGFEVGYDYLQISSTDRSYEPPSYNHILGNTTGMEQAAAQAYVNFLIFTSDNSNTGTGFRLEIVGYYQDNTRRVYDDFLSFTSVGSTTLRPYLNNMFQIFLIVPKHKTVSSLVIDIEYVTETRLDTFSVYSMERNGRAINFRQHARELSGNGTASFEAEYYANFLVIFYSSVQTIPINGGLELSWHASDNLSQENRAYRSG